MRPKTARVAGPNSPAPKALKARDFTKVDRIETVWVDFFAEPTEGSGKTVRWILR